MKFIFRSLFFPFRSLAELLFPRVCLVCGNALVEDEKYICTACMADFPFSDNSCPGQAEILALFAEPLRPVEFYSLFYYNRDSGYRKLIYAVKYNSRKKAGIYLGRMLGMRLKGRVEIDGIVPVPLHPRRERERGFNQARLIAQGVAEVLGVEVLDGIVVRTANNASQTGKDAAARRANVEDIFQLMDPASIRGRHVLVVDDVVTTGATAGACLYALAAAGEVRFTLACLARTGL